MHARVLYIASFSHTQPDNGLVWRTRCRLEKVKRRYCVCRTGLPLAMSINAIQVVVVVVGDIVLRKTKCQRLYKNVQRSSNQCSWWWSTAHVQTEADSSDDVNVNVKPTSGGEFHRQCNTDKQTEREKLPDDSHFPLINLHFPFHFLLCVCDYSLWQLIV